VRLGSRASDGEWVSKMLRSFVIYDDAVAPQVAEA
jgi:hypothetical protein